MEEIKKAKNHNLPLSLAFLNVDYFSYYNTLHGYCTGDLILKMIAETISSLIGKSDVACRYKEDEFAVIFPQSSSQEALSLVERIKSQVAHNFLIPDQEITGKPVTLCAGISSAPDNAFSPQELIIKAQKALIQAKIKGKNQCRLYTQIDNLTPTNKATILIVDDEPTNFNLIKKLLSDMDYTFLKASNGKEALSVIKYHTPDLILLDILMPTLNGYEVCRRLKQDERTRLIPIILTTNLKNLEDKITGIEVGADDYLFKPIRKKELTARVSSLLRVKRLNDQLENMENVILSLAKAVEAKDKYTLGHTERVSYYALCLGEKIGLSNTELRAIKIGGTLHDIGKIGVPESILNKPDSLTPEEWKIIKKHPEIGYNICLPLKDKLGDALVIVRHHHEKLNGTGYPDGLKGEAIPLVARIMAIADIYDALTIDRSYRPYIPQKKTMGILKNEAGQGLLDPELVNQFEKVLTSL